MHWLNLNPFHMTLKNLFSSEICKRKNGEWEWSRKHAAIIALAPGIISDSFLLIANQFCPTSTKLNILKMCTKNPCEPILQEAPKNALHSLLRGLSLLAPFYLLSACVMPCFACLCVLSDPWVPVLSLPSHLTFFRLGSLALIEAASRNCPTLPPSETAGMHLEQQWSLVPNSGVHKR